MSTLIDLISQANDLQKQIATIKLRDRSQVIGQVVEQITAFDITLAEVDRPTTIK